MKTCSAIHDYVNVWMACIHACMSADSFFLLLNALLINQTIEKGDSVDMKYTGYLLENGAIGKACNACFQVM